MDMNKAIDPPHAIGVRITPGTAEALLGDESLSLPKFDDSHYKDVTFSVLFVLNVVIVFALAFSSGISIFEFGHLEVKNTDGSRNNEDYSREPGKIIGGLIVILFSGGVLSLGWIVVLSKFATKIIPVTFGVIFMATGLAGVLMILSRMTILGICLVVGACISLLFFKLLRPHIELASCNLKIACEAIRVMPCTILAAGVIMMAQILFFFAWMIATIDVSTNQDVLNIFSRDGTKFKLSQCTTYLLHDNESLVIKATTLTCHEKNCAACVCGDVIVNENGACFAPKFYGGAYFGILLSLFWAASVMANVVHCSTAGAVAGWWVSTDLELTSLDCEFNNNEDVNKNSRVAMIVSSLLRNNVAGSTMVLKSLKRALSTSFGSICLGSLLVSTLRVLRMMVEFVTRSMRRLHNYSGLRAGHSLQLCFLSSLDYLLSTLERGISYFNRYAFCYVAIYGYDFMTASRSVVQMLSERGYSAVINDSIIDFVIIVGNIGGGTICMIIALLYCQAVHMSSFNTAMLVSLGAFTGYLLFSLSMEVVSSAVVAVYVCFAEKPAIFQATHPVLHFEIANAWSSVKQSNGGGGGGRGEGHEEEGKERGGGRGSARGGGGEGGIERSYMKKGVSGGGWSTYKYEAPPVLTEDPGSGRGTAFRPISVQGGERQDMEQGARQGQGQGHGQGQSMDRGWRNTDNDVEDMGENTGNASHTTTTAANVQNFASNAMKSISTTLFPTSTSRPIQTYAIHQKVNTADGDERNANRRGRDRGEENGALSSQLADEETVTF